MRAPAPGRVVGQCTAMCGSRKATGDVAHEVAMAALHLLAARKLLDLAESCRPVPGSVEMCDLVQGHLSETRALLVAMGLTDAELRALLSGTTK